MNNLEILFKKLSLGEITTVYKLLSNFEYDEKDLMDITTKFFGKYEDSIEFTNDPNEKVGLIYNLEFKRIK